MRLMPILLSALAAFSTLAPSAAAQETDSCVASASQTFEIAKSDAAQSLDIKYDSCRRKSSHPDQFEDCLTAALYRHTAAQKAAKATFDAALAACGE